MNLPGYVECGYEKWAIVPYYVTDSVWLAERAALDRAKERVGDDMASLIAHGGHNSGWLEGSRRRGGRAAPSGAVPGAARLEENSI